MRGSKKTIRGGEREIRKEEGETQVRSLFCGEGKELGQSNKERREQRKKDKRRRD